MDDSNACSKAFSHSFCGLRKVRFQCYCAQFKFNRIFLVLKLLSTTFYIIVKTLAQIPFVESSLWRFKKLVRRVFLTVFCGLRQVRFQCYCAQFKSNRIVLVLKLLSMAFYIVVKSLIQIPFLEASLWRNQILVRMPFLTIFCGLRKVRFQCYCAQFKFNRIVLVLKLLSTTFYIIVETLAQIPFVEASLWRIQILVRMPFLTIFCGLGKVRFECYCAQFNFNRIVLVLKLLSMTFYIIVKSLVLIPFVESWLWRIQMLVRRLSLTVFCGLCKVRFKCYCAQFKFNRIVLVLKLLSMTFYIIVETFLRYHSQKPRYGGLKNCVEDLFSQFLRITESTFPMLLCSVQVESYCSGAQTTFSGFYIIVETLAQIPFVEASLWRFKKTVSKTFSHSFCALRKVRFQCYCAQFKFYRIVLVLKLLSMTFYIIVETFLRYHSQNPRYGGFKCWFEGLFLQFLRITQSRYPMLLCAVKVQSDCSSAQTNFNDLLYHR